jgi:hypothetical protein
VFKEGILLRIFGPEREEARRTGENYMGRFVICTLRQILFG